MPRKRVIDPEFWSDEEIAGWSFAARLFYIGLWNFADDTGKLKAHPELLKAQIFPYNKIDVEKLQKEIGNKVFWYEVGGSRYGKIRNFLKYQRIDRPSHSILPEPTTEKPIFGEDSPSAQRGLVDGSLLIEVKLIEDKLREEWFAALVAKYPNKDGKKEAHSHFMASVKKESDWFNIQMALKNYLQSENVRKGYIKNASTWFNNWTDWIDFRGKYVPEAEKPAELTPEQKKAREEYIAKKQEEALKGATKK